MVAKLQSGHWWSNVPFTMMQPAHWLTNRTASGFLHRIPHSTQSARPAPEKHRQKLNSLLRPRLSDSSRVCSPWGRSLNHLPNLSSSWVMPTSVGLLVFVSSPTRGSFKQRRWCGAAMDHVVSALRFHLLSGHSSSCSPSGTPLARSSAALMPAMSGPLGGIYSNSSGIFKIRAVPAQ